MPKEPTIGTHADVHPDQYRFPRVHTGDLIHQEPIRPMWPWLAGGVFMLVIGTLVVVHAGSSVIALGGLLLALTGLALVGVFGHQLGREYDTGLQEFGDPWDFEK